jgi:hypothetical protein
MLCACLNPGGISKRRERVCHLQCRSVWLQMIIVPAGEHGGFHRAFDLAVPHSQSKRFASFTST